MSAVHVIEHGRQAAGLLHPLRRRLLEALRTPDSAAGLARKLDLPRQKLNYHLRSLEKDGLLELVEERRRGNCVERVMKASARAYVISPETLGALDADPADVRDRFSSSYLVAVAARAIRDIGALRPLAEQQGKRLATFTLQAEVRIATAANRKAFMEEMTDAIARLTAKYHDETAPGGRSYKLFVAGYPATTPAPDSTDSPGRTPGARQEEAG